MANTKDIYQKWKEAGILSEKLDCIKSELIPKTCTLIQYKCMQEGSHER